MSIETETEVITRLAMRGPLKTTALAAGCHRHVETIRRVVKKLIEDGEVVRTPEGRIRLNMATATKEKATKAAKDKTEAAPRGGPRAHTQELDEKVLKAIGTGKTGKTKAELAEAVASTESLVYGALHRLKKAGKVVINRVEGSRTPTYTRAAS